jgi:hypothetical protein
VILKAARSALRSHHKPAARIPKSRINREPKEAGRRAERLATPNSQGDSPSIPNDEFIGRLEGYLATEKKDIRTPFSKPIKNIYPDSSKKRIRGSRE